MKLYSYAGDYRALKALVAAKYGGVAIETPAFKIGTDNVTPEFLAKSCGIGKVPLLETDAGCVFESNAIARYVARVRADTGLMGASFFESGQVDAWLDWCSHELELPATMWVYPVLGYTEFNPAVHTRAVLDTHKALATLNAHLTKTTFLVGSAVTLADIVVAVSLLYPFKLVLDSAHRAAYPAVQRWFSLVVHQANVKAVLGDVPLAAKEMLAAGNKSKGGIPKAPKAKAAKGKGGGGAAAGGKGGGGAAAGGKAKGGKKAAAPAAAAAAAAPKPAAKPKDAFEALPRAKVSMDEIKRAYSNAPPGPTGDRDFYAVVRSDEFHELLANAGVTVWFCVYNYNDENTKDYTTSNLVGGFVQRCDAVRKHALGMMQILGSQAPYKVSGVWVMRGDSTAGMLEANPDAEYYTWTKMDMSDAAQKERFAQYMCDYETVDGQPILDSKLFK